VKGDGLIPLCAAVHVIHPGECRPQSRGRSRTWGGNSSGDERKRAQRARAPGPARLAL